MESISNSNISQHDAESDSPNPINSLMKNMNLFYTKSLINKVIDSKPKIHQKFGTPFLRKHKTHNLRVAKRSHSFIVIDKEL